MLSEVLQPASSVISNTAAGNKAFVMRFTTLNAVGRAERNYIKCMRPALYTCRYSDDQNPAILLLERYHR
jgi:hypothetical protein